jgi:phenylpropionate dioxygenase-like ring-hydroxylating dioxygenase large terminal subunit
MCNFRYEVLIENLMDPAHTTYAHYGIMNTVKPKGMHIYDKCFNFCKFVFVLYIKVT